MRRELLLIHPPFYRLHRGDWSLDELPLGLGYLAAVVAREGEWGVRVYNADFVATSAPAPDHAYLVGEGRSRFRAAMQSRAHGVWREVREVVAEVKPTVVGIGVTSPLAASARRVASIVRDEVPDAVIVWGGAHASLVPGAVLGEVPEVDVCVVGEGEATLSELLRCVASGATPHEVRGLAWRDGDAVRQNPARPLLEDLDSLPFPSEITDNHLVDAPRYPKRALASLITSRGCPFGCRYCGCDAVWTRRVRQRSAQDVIDEMHSLHRRHGLDDFVLRDDTFTLSGDRLRDLCRGIHAARFGWAAQLHPTLADDARLQRMARCGCHTVCIGLETGNEELLRSVRPSTTVAQGEQAAAAVRRHGMRLLAYYLVGLPGESPETIRQTEQLIRRVAADLNVISTFTPYPGTELYEQLRVNGSLGRSAEIELQSHTSAGLSFSEQLSDDQLQRSLRRLAELTDRMNRQGRLRYYSRHPGRLLSRLAERHLERRRSPRR